MKGEVRNGLDGQNFQERSPKPFPKGQLNGYKGRIFRIKEKNEENDDCSDEDGQSDSSSDSENPTDVVKACNKQRLQRARSIPAPSPLDYRIYASMLNRDSVRKRKLIIHLDIRNTILVADSVTNVSVEEALNSFLTGVVWGSEQNGNWVWHSDIPSLKAPAPGLVTFYKYLEKKLVKNCQDRVNLRIQTGDFVHSGPGKRFQKHFGIHLARLKWLFHDETSIDKVLTMSGKDGKPYHYILPSVYKLLLNLAQEKRDFAIIIRTYGRDANNVLSSLSYGLKGHHPAFQKSISIPVQKEPGTIHRGKDTFLLKTYKSKNCEEVQQELKFDRDIYRLLCESQGISGFVDDFQHWQNNNYDHAAGKPLFIDPTDHRHHHIFFDDNFRTDEEDSIIDVRMFSKENPTTAESVSHAEVARLENVCLVQADLLDAIADEDYFIRMTRTCEDNYARMMKAGEL